MAKELDMSDSANVLESQSTTFTILIVDDDQDCRALVRDAIGALGGNYRVIEHANGKDATDFLFSCPPSSRPDVIFLDLEMPRMGGLETLEMVKAHPRLKDIPVIILTGVVDKDIIERAALLGANSYTIKPSRVDQFIQTILASANYWLNVHQYPRHGLSQNSARR
jgi:CheY-like chemotaxis protein